MIFDFSDCGVAIMCVCVFLKIPVQIRQKIIC